MKTLTVIRIYYCLSTFHFLSFHTREWKTNISVCSYVWNGRP